MKTALITGANRGIGLEFVKQLSEKGYQVIACARNPEKADELQALSSSNENISAHQLDVSKQETIDKLSSDFKDTAIDILINNAGIMGDSGITIGNIDRDNFLNTININCLGTLKVSEAFLPQVQKSDEKLIVAISSQMGSISDNTSGRSYAYRTSKAALNCVMHSFAIDVNEMDVKVLLLHPGWVQTRMGGTDALISVTESVSGMMSQIETFKSDSHADVLRRFDGDTIAW